MGSIPGTTCAIVTLLLTASLHAQNPGALKLPLRFEPASSAAGADIRFLAHANASTVFLTSSGAVLAFRDSSMRLEFSGARPKVDPVGLEPSATRSDYFLGSRPDQWRLNVPSYSKVKYAAVYPGVDLIYYGTQDHLEYDFLVSPGARADAIRLDLKDARIHLTATGDLFIDAGARQVTMRKPRAYQQIHGVEREIDVSYQLDGRGLVGFRVAPYDRRHPLIIDPVLSYSTYLGGTGDEGGMAIAVDNAGNTYIAGTTASARFPNMPARPGAGTDTDAFVAKLTSSGTALAYIAYLGGTGNEIATGLALDDAGNVYVAGGTGSQDFPTTRGALQTSYKGSANTDLLWWLRGVSGDAFIAKLNPAGSGLVYSTYLGGSGADLALRLRVDSTGNAYVTGNTRSTDFPTTPGAFQTTARGGSGDTWVAKINAAGSALIYSTYLAGTGDAGDIAFGLAIDAAGDAYLTGVSDEGFPVTPGSFQTTLRGRWDAFVAKLNATGTALIYATYLGSTGETYGFDIAVDASGDAYVTGTSSAGDFPVTAGAFHRPIPRGAQGGKVFVTKLNETGSALVYSTSFGGGNADFGLAIAVNSAGNAYVAGRTRSRNFPQTGDTLQCRHGGGQTDAFLLELDGTGSNLLHSTFVGGAGDETVGGIALDAADNLFVTGSTTSNNFPVTASTYQTAFGGGPTPFFDTDALTPVGGDAFVAKFTLDTPAVATIGCITNAASLDPAGVSPGEIVSIWGVRIGPQDGTGTRLDESGRLATSVAETRVLFDGIPAPLTFVRADLINAVVPYAVAANQVTYVQVEYQGSLSNTVTWPVLSVHPGIFTVDTSGTGQGAILNEDLSYNSATRPAARGSVIVLFGTGAGQTDPPGEDGKIAAAPLPKPLASVEVYIYGKKAEVLYAGAAPTLVSGALQVNARVPDDVPAGDAIPIWLVMSGGLVYEGVTVAIK